jgi:hypothetical protein
MLRFRFALALVFLGAVSLVRANVLLVPTDYQTVQAAVNNAQSGDTVLIERGQYPEWLSIPDRDLTIAGRFLFTRDTTDIDSAVLAVPDSSQNTPNLTANSLSPTTSLTLLGLRIRGHYTETEQDRSGGVQIQGGRFLMQRCRLDSINSVSDGVLATTQTECTISDCHFRDCGNLSSQSVLTFTGGSARMTRCTLERLFTSDEGNGLVLTDDTLSIRDCRMTGSHWLADQGIEVIQARSWGAAVTIAGCEFDTNYFWRFISEDPNDLSNLIEFRIDSNYIHDNKFFMSMNELTQNRRLRLQFVGNTIEHNGDTSSGVYSRCCFSTEDSWPRLLMTGNLFLNNYMYGHSVVQLSGGSPDFQRVSRNYIIGNISLGTLSPPGAPITLTRVNPGVFVENIIVGNRPYAAVGGAANERLSHAELNYWGHETGPFHATENPLGMGDSVGSRIIVTPWYTDTTLSVTPLRPAPVTAGEFIFGHAYPNPFNATVTFEFAVLKTLEVRLEIFDLTGRRVATLLDETRRVGVHTVEWNPQSAASGVYFARLSSGSELTNVAIKKVLYLK